MTITLVTLEDVNCSITTSCDENASPEIEINVSSKKEPNYKALEEQNIRLEDATKGTPEEMVARFQNLDETDLCDFEKECIRTRIIRWLLENQNKIYYSAVDKTCMWMHAQAGTLTREDKDALVWDGLRKALKAFDPTREAAVFSTFAFTCIQNETRSRLKDIFTKNEAEVSLDAPLTGNHSDDDKDATMMDKLASEKLDPQTNLHQQSVEKIMHNLLEKLDPQTRFSIVHYYGLFGNMRNTEEQIGEFMGMSQASVSKKVSDGVVYLEQHTTPAEKRLILSVLCDQ